ncbi:MAG: TonB family protein [Melioribacter sp.]|nr:TonB family protein [Melioribacter sp.]
MKTKLIFLVLLLSAVGVLAQQKAKVQKSDESGFMEVDEVPVLISKIKPSYPEIARLAGIEGTVYLKVLVDENGNVEKAKVEQGAKEILDNSALQAAKKAKFSPAMLDNKPVKAWVILPVAFKLDLEKKAEARILKYNELGPPPSNKKDEEAEIVSPGIKAPSNLEDPDVNEFRQVQKFPEMIESAKPEYPEVAKRAGITGKVFVKVLVDKEGTPKKAIVIKSEAEILNQSAVDAALKSKFTPALDEGKPISVWIVLPYKFNLDDKKESTDTFPAIPDITWLITSNKPDYPTIALEKKLEGIVSFKVLFNKNDMNITKIDLIKGADEILNKEAMAYVKKEFRSIIEYFETKRQEYIKKHPESSASDGIKDIAIIRIDYRIEE